MSNPDPAPDLIGAALVIVHAACNGCRRKDGTPAVLHPLAVMRLVHEAGVRDPVNLAVALLHDVLEDRYSDRPTWEQRIRAELGEALLQHVRLLTDDMSLPAVTRKARQIIRMPGLPPALRSIKLADRLANLRQPHPDWGGERLRLYAAQSRALLSVCRDANPFLAAALVDQLARPPWSDGPSPPRDHTGGRPRGAG